jgi:hypothetical protein
VIELVLNAPGLEVDALDATADVLDDDPRRPPDVGGQIGDREAALASDL